MPTVFLRIQYGIENCLKKRCVKELVVAVERSKNDSVLLQLLSWAENHLTPGQVEHSLKFCRDYSCLC